MPLPLGEEGSCHVLGGVLSVPLHGIDYGLVPQQLRGIDQQRPHLPQRTKRKNENAKNEKTKGMGKEGEVGMCST